MIKSVHNNNRFDYIIAGAGCAGLSLLVRILQQEATKHKRILLVDRSNSSMLNKTWCFWEKEPDIFESIVHQQYDQLWYHGKWILADQQYPSLPLQDDQGGKIFIITAWVSSHSFPM